MLGYSPNASKNMKDYIIGKVAGYSSILGLLEEKENGRIYQSKYPFMVFLGYDAKNNTMHFASPYFNALIMKITESSIQRDKQNRPKLKTNGEPFMKPSHSYLIKSSIAKERNQKAIEIVCVITALIEQAGNNTPHISAQTIIDRCPKLKSALDECEKPKDRNIILKRAFSKAWALLREQTHLTEVYKDIQLPPCVKTLFPLPKPSKRFTASHITARPKAARKPSDYSNLAICGFTVFRGAVVCCILESRYLCGFPEFWQLLVLSIV